MRKRHLLTKDARPIVGGFFDALYKSSPTDRELRYVGISIPVFPEERK